MRDFLEGVFCAVLIIVIIVMADVIKTMWGG
jgi:hypothetical protein